MTVSCPDCQSVFRVDPDKVPGTGVRARCSVCGGVIAIAGGGLPIAVTPAPVFVPPTMTSAPAPAAVTAPVEPVEPPAVVRAHVESVEVMETVATSESGDTPVAARSVAAVVDEATLRPMAWEEVPAPAPVYRGAPEVVPAMHMPTASPPAAEMSAPVMPPELRPATNPFLSVDPDQRARRLARALASDLVAYHPEKRDEGLQFGTLKKLFRDDITKSYEEYVDQVGQELAEETPYFRDALNDILAGGQPLF